MVLLRSVKNWLTLLVVGLVALSMLVAWLYVVPPLGSRLERQKLTGMRKNGGLVSSTVGEFTRFDEATGKLTVEDQPALEQVIGRIAMRVNARVIVLSRDAVPVADSGGEDPFRVRDFALIAKAIGSGDVRQGLTTTSYGRFAATAVPLPVDLTPRRVAGAVLLLAPLDDVDQAVASVKNQLLLAAALALLVSLAASLLVSTFIAGRLKRIEASAETVAGGDLSVTVPVGLEDEIGQLARSFNVMAERLRDAFSQVEFEKDRIEILLNDLSEGVIGISAEGRVTITNPATATLLGRDLPVGAELGRAFPFDVADIWYASRQSGEVQDVVFVQGERTLQAVTYPAGDEADFTFIIVLRDVTAQAKLERARRDFIANASHEFKTPLFSLAGFLEILDEGSLSPEEQHEFLQLMRQQVDRLRTLAVSMLDLSRVEAESIELTPSDVDLAAVARSVLDEFQTQTQAKGLAVVVESTDGPVTAWCDEERVAQVLRALVDNAVKFSPDGASVTIAVVTDEETALVTVHDTGPGIPEEDLPRVFERFHRGRQERATSPGSGLGLSIARELTELMGGTVTAASPPGDGAAFTVRLPRRPARSPRTPRETPQAQPSA
ncbi:MAG TPA: ATP-binding protein [Thermoleophilia bacterium]|nr:ATP-binding protein [Thermoleophilia bacterium]